MERLVTDELCSAPGVEELYGLGVRISLYLQYVAVIFASFTRSKEQFDRVRDVALLSGAATAITLFRGTTHLELNALDVQMVCGLYFGQIVVGLLDMKWPNPGFWIRVIILIYFYGFSAFFIWFWFHGLDVIPRYPCPDTYAFGFSKVDLYGGYRSAMKFNCIFVPVYLLFNAAIKDRYHPGIVRMVVAVVYLVLSIIGTELTIKFNNVSNVYNIATAEQLIPLVISALLVFYVLFRNVNPDELPPSTSRAGSGMVVLTRGDNIKLGGNEYAKTTDGRIVQLGDGICECHGGRKILRQVSEQEFARIERLARERPRANMARADVEAGSNGDRHDHGVEEQLDKEEAIITGSHHAKGQAHTLGGICTEHGETHHGRDSDKAPLGVTPPTSDNKGNGGIGSSKTESEAGQGLRETSQAAGPSQTKESGLEDLTWIGDVLREWD